MRERVAKFPAGFDSGFQLALVTGHVGTVAFYFALGVVSGGAGAMPWAPPPRALT
jgi:hypothetical protein